VRLEWTRRLPSAPVRVLLAREVWRILVQEVDALRFWDGRGEADQFVSLESPLRCLHLSDLANLLVTIDERNRLLGFSSELEQLWHLPWDRPLRAVAVAPLGQQFAVADDQGVSVMNTRGERLWRTITPRPLHHLAWIPETLSLVGAADLGLLCGFDRGGTIRWREGLMTHIGSLAVRGDGHEILLACFSDGIRVRQQDRSGCPLLAGSTPCRALAASYSADVLFTLDLEARGLERLDRGTGGKQVIRRDSQVSDFASDAAGQTLVVGTAGGELSLWVTS
jgi:hypothetical protein